jgi:cytochrome bd-type quinol oxidase subunit 2
MDEYDIRPERIPGTNVDRDIITGRTTTTTPVGQGPAREVDIRRTTIMGRDLAGRAVVTTPLQRTLSWGPIFGGLMTSLVTSMLFGSLFLGLGFDRSYGVFGGLTSSQVGIGAAIATLIGVFIGGYLTGYASDIRTKAESVLNGFMVGIMAIALPLFVGAVTGLSAGANPSVTSNLGNVSAPSAHVLRYNLAVAADNAWQVFLVGVLVLAVSSLAGYLGRKNREKAIAMQASHDLDAATTY